MRRILLDSAHRRANLPRATPFVESVQVAIQLTTPVSEDAQHRGGLEIHKASERLCYGGRKLASRNSSVPQRANMATLFAAGSIFVSGI
jgi:hypothetical protein